MLAWCGLYDVIILLNFVCIVLCNIDPILYRFALQVTIRPFGLNKYMRICIEYLLYTLS